MTARRDSRRDDAGARPLIYLVAGEPSGDVLGARLMAALKRETGGAVDFAGIGGEEMTAEGLDSLFPMSELSVMGIAEIVPSLAKLLRRIAETASDIRRRRPDAVVTIDAPAFCKRVLRRLGDTGIPRIHYVAPTVWAWRPWRARRFARVADRLMVLLPFEPPWFERVGLPADFVGHPVLECGALTADGARFRAGRGIASDVTVLCVLPGSRTGEVRRLLPPFAEAVARLHREIPDLQVVIPTLGAVADEVSAAVAGWGPPVMIVRGGPEKFDAMAASDAAIAASGTVALELAMAGVPNVIAYRVHPVTAAIVRRLISARYANLVNILLDREAVPEFLQEACRGDALAESVLGLLRDPAAAAAQRSAMADAIRMLSAGDATPSDAAARVVLGVVAGRTTKERA